MTQYEIVQLLKKRKKWMTSIQISKELKEDRGRITVKLRKVRRLEQIEFKIDNRKSWNEMKYRYIEV